MWTNEGRGFGKSATMLGHFRALAKKHGPDKKYRVLCVGTSKASAMRMAALFTKIEPSYIYELSWPGMPTRGKRVEMLDVDTCRALLEG